MINSQTIPFQKSFLPLFPIVIRGDIRLNQAANQIEIEYWFCLRFAGFFRLPGFSIVVPVGAISNAEVKRRKLRLRAFSSRTFHHLGTGLLDLRIPAHFKKEARAVASEVNFRAALATVA